MYYNQNSNNFSGMKTSCVRKSLLETFFLNKENTLIACRIFEKKKNLSGYFVYQFYD